MSLQSANTRHRAGPLMRTMLPRFRDCGKAPLRAEMSSAMPAAGALPPPLCCGTSPPRLAAMKRPLSMAIRHVFLQTAMIRHIFVSEIIEPRRSGTSRISHADIQIWADILQQRWLSLLQIRIFLIHLQRKRTFLLQYWPFIMYGRSLMPAMT